MNTWGATLILCIGVDLLQSWNKHE
jgi:hypothetical protein